MRIFAPAALALLLPLISGSNAALAACSATQNDGICGNRELMGLRDAGAAKLKALAAAADPLTALLMRRDQVWVMEMVSGMDGGGYDPDDQPERLRKERVLKRRIADLNRLVGGAVAEGPTGRWINALGRAQVEKRGDAIAVTIVSHPDYGAGLPTECRAKAELKPGSDGWYAGVPTLTQSDDGDDSEDAIDGVTPDAPTASAAANTSADTKIELRVRLQGNTLRVVMIRGIDADFHFCGGIETVTGSYFVTGPGAGRGVNLAARTVAPSFDCASARNEDEEEICSDPDLAKLDTDIARIYRDTLKRLDTKLAGELRDDQRAWSKGNTQVFDTFLHPYWDKRHYFVTQTGNARTEWATRLAERLGMLGNLDEKRQGLAGYWMGYNAMLAIVPDKDDKGGVSVTGGKWVTGDYKSHCDFEGNGEIAGNSFKTDDDEMPKL
jgi:hypothetical protein